MRLDWLAGQGGPIRGRLRVPGDKSISHRALMLAAIAEGSSRISGFLEGEDTRATAAILRQLGVQALAQDLAHEPPGRPAGERRRPRARHPHHLRSDDHRLPGPDPAAGLGESGLPGAMRAANAASSRNGSNQGKPNQRALTPPRTAFSAKTRAEVRSPTSV